jgi:carboxypeptidase D
MVPTDQPARAFTFLREFILGNNPQGRVTKTPSGKVTIVGGSDPNLANDILPGSDDPIYYGEGVKDHSYLFPAATRVAWDSFTKAKSATSTKSPKPTPPRKP